MAETRYRRELNHSYLVIQNTDPDLTQGYAYRMMNRNRIRKLLPCQERSVDGESWLYYEITSRQPIARLYEGRRMDAAQIGRILEAVAALQEDLGEYLLDGRGLLLDPSLIFAEVDTEELFFCFDPGAGREEDRYADLADFFLEHADHGQEQAVNLAYQFYKLSKTDFFVVETMLPYLEKETPPPETSAAMAGRGWDGEGEEPRAAYEETEEKPQKKRAGRLGLLLQRLFSPGKERRKERAQQEEKPSGNELSIWDTYAGRLDAPETGETVYFADLEKPKAGMSGTPFLREQETGRRFLLENLPVTVGKLEGKAQILLEDRSVSRLHARIFEEDGEVWLMDLNSRNGTMINDRKLAPNESAPLTFGDEVRFGRERFRFGFIDSGGH